MAIKASDVASLRAKTGIGMMECKKALEEANGDVDEAIKILREKGLAVAAKKSSRIAAEGIVDISFDEETGKAAMIEVNIETDFAAKNAVFGEFVSDLLKIIIKNNPKNMEEFNALPFSDDMTVEAAVKDKIFTIGENINVRRFCVIDDAASTYVHGKGTIGVIVKMAGDSKNEAVRTAAKNVALQIAAMNPTYLDKESVPASVVENEREIVITTIKNDEANASKPENIIEKMAIGKLNKFFDQNCLLLQDYVKDDSMKVAGYLKSVAAEIGAPVTVESFVRYEKGEGIEKKEEDFAEEIAKLTGK